MTRTELLEIIRRNPGCNSSTVARIGGLTSSSAATRTKQLFDVGLVTRTRKILPRTKTPQYFYTVVDGAQDKPKAERLTSQPLTHDEPKTSPLDSILSDFVGGFAKSLASAIVDQLKPQLERELRLALPSALPTIPPVVPVHSQPESNVEPEVLQRDDKPRLPRVGVVGIAPNKRFALDKEFGSLLDLQYWWVEDPTSKLKSNGVRCETVFVMNYVAHKHTELLTSVGANWVWVKGDVRALGDLLADYCLRKAA